MCLIPEEAVERNEGNGILHEIMLNLEVDNFSGHLRKCCFEIMILFIQSKTIIEKFCVCNSLLTRHLTVLIFYIYIYKTIRFHCEISIRSCVLELATTFPTCKRTTACIRY